MEKHPILAIMYDFDHTLSPRDMQEYGFIPDLGMEPDVFWNKCVAAMKKNQMDQILAYMYMMIEEAKGKFDVVFPRQRLRGKPWADAGALYHLLRLEGDHRGHAHRLRV